MKVELAVLKEDGSRQVVPVEASEASIGRSSKNDISFNEKTVSRNHCKIKSNGESITIEDLDSTNGTFVDGVKVKQQQLKGGETIKLGNLEMQLKVSGQESDEKISDTEEAEAVAVSEDELQSEDDANEDELEAFGAEESGLDFDMDELEDL